MSQPAKKRLPVVGALLGAGGSLAAALAVTLALAGSAAAAAGAPANTAPPTTSGTPQQGQTLTAHAGSWSGTQPTRFGNQWQRCNSSGTACAPIRGATGKRYTLARADIGHTIRLKETATNAAGSSSSSSAATAVVKAAPATAPANTSPPTVSGTPQQGHTLNAANGTWSGTEPIRFTYKWQRCDSSGGSCSRIVGATSSSYPLTSADVGNTVRLTVTGTNSVGTSSSTSVPTAVVASLQSTAPVNVSPARISGTTKQGQALTAHPGTWQGANPISRAYQWKRCDANGGNCVDIAGATGQSYTLVSNDVGQTLRVRVTATNGSGTGISTSVPTGVVSSGGTTTSANGCPISSGTVSVNAVVAPSRLVVNRFQSAPSVVRKSGHQLAIRFHITDTCGQPVRGALVYSAAVPFSQFNVPAEQPTDASGNATLYFHTLAGFPASRSQRSVVFFVRARRAGDPILAGISGERLISLPFNPKA